MPLMQRNILFILRVDASIKGGGDLVQATWYKEILEQQLGYKVYFAHEYTLRELRNKHWDLVQLFNISRLFENYALVRELSYNSLLLTPIMQPGFSFDVKSIIKSMIRIVLTGKLSLLSFKNKPKNMLQLFDGVVFLSNLEREAFNRSFPENNIKNQILFENGVDERLHNDGRFALIDFIVVGRIEPKKRIIEAIDMVSSVNLDLTFISIGGLNWYHPIYCIRFLLRVLTGKVIYFGKRKEIVVANCMKVSNTLLNFSELEVSPLVDLEALACGCRVISTIYSYSHLIENERYVSIDVKNNEACLSAIRASLETIPTQASYVKTWHENAGQYVTLVNALVEKYD